MYMRNRFSSGGSLRVQRQLSNLKLKIKKQGPANAHRKSPKKGMMIFYALFAV